MCCLVVLLPGSVHTADECSGCQMFQDKPAIRCTSQFCIASASYDAESPVLSAKNCVQCFAHHGPLHVCAVVCLVWSLLLLHHVLCTTHSHPWALGAGLCWRWSVTLSDHSPSWSWIWYCCFCGAWTLPAASTWRGLGLGVRQPCAPGLHPSRRAGLLSRLDLLFVWWCLAG